MLNRVFNINKTFKNSIKFIKQIFYKYLHIYQRNNHLLDLGMEYL